MRVVFLFFTVFFVEAFGRVVGFWDFLYFWGGSLVAWEVVMSIGFLLRCCRIFIVCFWVVFDVVGLDVFFCRRGLRMVIFVVIRKIECVFT